MKSMKSIKTKSGKKVKQLTEKELTSLWEILGVFETVTVKETGVRQISGGFALASMFDYDDKTVDIELKWGIHNDCENVVHIEQWKLKRNVLLNEKKTVFQKVACIESA